MKLQTKTLPNGLRIVLAPLRDNPTVTILTLVATGSKYETKSQSGLSHFLEHMCFKGTAMRPSAHDIAHELDGLGAQYNAFTSHEYTGYYAKSQSKHFDQILNIISDIYLNSTFPKAEIEKEKGVILEEMNMYEDMPNRDVQYVFMSLVYGDQPAGWKIIGTKDVVRSMKQEDFISYHTRSYVAAGTVVVVAGDIPADAQKKIMKAFASIRTTPRAKKKKVTDIQKAPQTLLKYKATDQTHLVLGVRTYEVGYKDNAILAVISCILGGGMSSRLFQTLREEMGVAYYVYAQNESYTDHGLFSIAAGIDKTRTKEVLQKILSACAVLKTELVSEKELHKVKEYIIGNTKLGLEGSDAVAMYAGERLILDRPLETISAMSKKIEAVTKEDIRRVARKIFIDTNINLACVGPEKDEKAFFPLLHF